MKAPETQKAPTDKVKKTASGAKIRLELVRSVNGTPRWMRTIVRTLALRKMRDVVVVGDNPAIRGMVAKVPHLIDLQEVKG